MANDPDSDRALPADAALEDSADLGEGVEDFADAPSDSEPKADAEADRHTERQLDKGLKETFPASDPVSINPGAD